ncbi:hypothetical protein [Nocardia flavorosea]|uniref:Uncharacterized protein n=1 Tax=Nocardia flavorosea TaxID=53429 RepID=A0A846YCT6_9NOCA|nr:hypothetical protein [Nocardia flavorosea]NKY57406.1 hypothetical protein [Nocardia flavorosea]
MTTRKPTAATMDAIVDHISRCGGETFVPTHTPEARAALARLIEIGMVKPVWRDGRLVHQLQENPK